MLLGESVFLVIERLPKQSEKMESESDAADRQARLAVLGKRVRLSKQATEIWHPQYAAACVKLADYYDQNM